MSVVARIYDPLGVISPVVIPVKVLFQQICRRNGHWDQELDDDHALIWKKWIFELRKAHQISLPRCYFISASESVYSAQLHAFSDGSKDAFAGTIYLRFHSAVGVSTSLVTSKMRVAPLDIKSIPRLELLGALIVTRLITRVRRTLGTLLHLNEVYCWTDNTGVLYWIKGTNKEYKQFVENRLREIRRLTQPESWAYVPSSSNPADIPTRGMTAQELMDSDLWWYGPPWLSQPPEFWPKYETSSTPPEECIQEMKENDKKLMQETVSMVSTVETMQLESVISSSDYSRSTRLVRVTAFVLRFINNLKLRVASERVMDSLTASEYQQAEFLWIRSIQNLERKKPNFQQKSLHLGLYEDQDGVQRCKGRLGNAVLPFDARFPIFLPSDNHLTALIIEECHRKVLHNGVKETLTELRSRFWVPRGRQVVRRVIARCSVCKRFEGQHYSVPPAAALPGFRLEEQFAFTNTGVDFCGPLFVKAGTNEKGHMNKVHIALFTCCSSHAIHVDLVPDLTTEAFLRCFKHFTCRRGIPRLIVSDNAKTFKSSAKKLCALFELPEVLKLFCELKIKWRFNLERAPWWGGASLRG